MGLFPFATRFARALQLAFVASPPTNTIRSSSSLVDLRPSSLASVRRTYPPFSSDVRAVIKTVVFARMWYEIISEIASPEILRRVVLRFDNFSR